MIQSFQKKLLKIEYKKEEKFLYKKYNLKVLGERIKEKRIKKGLSIEEIYIKTGLNKNVILKIEKGENVLLKHLDKLANLYDITVEELVTGIDGRFCENFYKFNIKKRNFIYEISELLSKSNF